MRRIAKPPMWVLANAALVGGKRGISDVDAGAHLEPGRLSLQGVLGSEWPVDAWWVRFLESWAAATGHFVLAVVFLMLIRGLVLSTLGGLERVTGLPFLRLPWPGSPLRLRPGTNPLDRRQRGGPPSASTGSSGSGPWRAEGEVRVQAVRSGYAHAALRARIVAEACAKREMDRDLVQADLAQAGIARCDGDVAIDLVVAGFGWALMQHMGAATTPRSLTLETPDGATFAVPVAVVPVFSAAIAIAADVFEAGYTPELPRAGVSAIIAHSAEAREVSKLLDRDPATDLSRLRIRTSIRGYTHRELLVAGSGLPHDSGRAGAPMATAPA